MALGDFTLLREGQFGVPGAERYIVASGAAASIKAGEPVGKALAAAAVATLATNKPVVATDFLAGISSTTSSDTAAAAGVVDVIPVNSDQVWLCAPNNAALWDTQAEYNALVGARVLLDKTAGVYTVLSTDGATSGCVVRPLEVAKYPGKVAISFRAGCSYLA